MSRFALRFLVGRLAGKVARVRSSAVLLGALPLILGACAGVVAAPVSRLAPPAQQLDFLAEGGTTREDSLVRLGLPSAEFEDHRIFVYRLAKNRTEGFRVVPRELDPGENRISHWADEEYSLVLVFDTVGVLRKHRLIGFKREDVGTDRQVPGADVEQVGRRLGFLVRGVTTREDVLLRLGLPSTEFQGERVLAFRLERSGDRIFVVQRELAEDDRRFSRWDDAEYSLVVVFDAGGVLEEFGVVKVR